MSSETHWSNRKSRSIFLFNHDFFMPLILFSGMLVTDRLEVMLSVLGVRVYDSDHIVPLLFYSGITFMAISYSFKSFIRWSKFRMSQQHPLINFFLNINMTLLPIAAIVIHPLLILPLLVIHWFSHVRSPEIDEVKYNFGILKRTYFLIIMQLVICYIAIFIVSFHLDIISDLTMWNWMSYR